MTKRKPIDMTRNHKCPWCKREREAPVNVLAHVHSDYTVTCDCGKQYRYNYLAQKAWK